MKLISRPRALHLLFFPHPQCDSEEDARAVLRFRGLLLAALLTSDKNEDLSCVSERYKYRRPSVVASARLHCLPFQNIMITVNTLCFLPDLILFEPR